MTWWFGLLLAVVLASLLVPDLRKRRRKSVAPTELGRLIAAGRAKSKLARSNEQSDRRSGPAVGAFHRER